MKQSVNTNAAPQPIGIYSQAIKSGNMVFLSGQIPLHPVSNEIFTGDIRQQVDQVFRNLVAVTQVAGGTLNDIVRLCVYLTDINQSVVVNEFMEKLFTQPYPARTTIQVAGLPKGVAVEIDAIMVLSY